MTKSFLPCLMVAVVLLLTGCATAVAADLDENVANEIVVALVQSGVVATKEPDPDHEGRWRVTVPSSDGSTAIAVLEQRNLPPETTTGVLAALGDGSIVPSRASEHARLVAGTAGELERSLRDVDGVLEARVHLAVPPSDALALGSAPQSPTASVLIRHSGPTSPLPEGDVQRLVAGAVAGLTPEHVSVVATPAPTARQPAERPLAHFGPITVTRASLPPLRVAVGAIVAIDLSLLAAVLIAWMRLRRTQLALEQARVDTASDATT